ncbi:MAG: hypothetical protein ACTHNS_13925 [Marmoricola sp.]
MPIRRGDLPRLELLPELFAALTLATEAALALTLEPASPPTSSPGRHLTGRDR